MRPESGSEPQDGRLLGCIAGLRHDAWVAVTRPDRASRGQGPILKLLMMIKEAEGPFVLILLVQRRSLSNECVLGSLLNAPEKKPPAVSLSANQEPPFVNQGKLDLATVDCALNSPQSHSYFNHTGPAINHQAVLCDCDEYSVTC